MIGAPPTFIYGFNGKVKRGIEGSILFVIDLDLMDIC